MRSLRPAPPAATVVERLFTEHATEVRARVARRDPSLADDVVSDTFAVALRRAAAIPNGAERAWLFVVADNVLRNHQRGRRRAAALTQSLTPHVAASTPAPSLAVVGDALRDLPDRERALLTMTAFEGLSTGEAAERLGIATGTAMNAMVTGRRRLSARLAALGVAITTVLLGFVFAEAAQAGARTAPEGPVAAAYCQVSSTSRPRSATPRARSACSVTLRRDSIASATQLSPRLENSSITALPAAVRTISV